MIAAAAILLLAALQVAARRSGTGPCREKRFIHRLFERPARLLTKVYLIRATASPFAKKYEGLPVDRETYVYRSIRTSLQLLLLLSVVISIKMAGDTESGDFVERLQRPGHEESDRREILHYETAGEEGVLPVEVPRRRYSDDELDAMQSDIRERLTEALAGENERLDDVHKPLHFIRRLSAVDADVVWQYNREFFERDGTPKPRVKRRVGTAVKAVLHYPSGKRTEETFFITLSPSERVGHRLSEAVKVMSEEVRLPTDIEGQRIRWYREGKSGVGGILIFAVILMAAWPLYRKNMIDKAYALRRRALQLEYVEVLNLLILYLETGLTVPQAWVRLTSVYRARDTYLTRELEKSLHRMQTGQSTERMFRDFAASCDLREYRKLGQLLTRNIRSGSDTVLQLLRQEVETTQRERTMRAKRLGKQAETKLLLPMMLMLAVVFVILVAPGILQMKG
ncbi:MAG: type II secretion system F family protein [Eubacteriales bacterium]|nr:type II secretion system F family protein [Eubacteriales bacterium]